MNNKLYMYNTSSYAKERLVNMLASDRIGCNPDFLDDMRHTIKQEIDRYVDVRETDIDIKVKEKMLIAYIPLVNERICDTGRTTEQGTLNYEAMEERTTELKTIQS